MVQKSTQHNGKKEKNRALELELNTKYYISHKFMPLRYHRSGKQVTFSPRTGPSFDNKVLAGR